MSPAEIQARTSAFQTAVDKLNLKYDANIQISRYNQLQLINNRTVPASYFEEAIDSFYTKVLQGYDTELQGFKTPVETAQTALNTAQTEVDNALKKANEARTALTEKLSAEPFSNEITQLKKNLNDALFDLDTKQMRLSGRITILNSADETYKIALKSYNEKNLGMNKNFVKVTKPALDLTSVNATKSSATTAIDNGYKTIMDFPQTLQADKAAAISTAETELKSVNKAITDLDTKISTQTTTLETKKTALNTAKNLPEETQSQISNKIKKINTAKTAYKTALNNLNQSITDRNTKINTRASNPNYTFLEEHAPTSTQYTKSFSISNEITTSVNADANKDMLRLGKQFQSLGETELTGLMGTANTEASEANALSSEVDSLQNQLDYQTKNATTERMKLRARITLAKLNNKISALNTAVSKASSSTTALTDRLATFKSNLGSVLGKTETQVAQIVSKLPPRIPVNTTSISNIIQKASVLKQLNNPFFNTIRFVSAEGVANESAGLGSILSHAIRQHFGIDALARSVYSLFNPTGKYALPKVSARPISGASTLTRTLARSPFAQSAIRTALPFLRVLRAGIGAATAIFEPISWGLQICEAIE